MEDKINKIKPRPTSELFPNSQNPRNIRDDKFKQLCESLKNFPQMLNLRPIIHDENDIILGGNQRFAAAVEIGMKTVPTLLASDLTEEQKKEFIIKDNNSYGQWDYDSLANEWDPEDLKDWNLDIPNFDYDAEPEKEKKPRTNKIEFSVKIKFASEDQMRDAEPELIDLINEKYPGATIELSEIIE